ncbi:MAG TPA: hypothetical protein VM260_17345, partial [Pirellula sp.]|nr:hypothetical protein [Pirellula sp.]
MNTNAVAESERKSESSPIGGGRLFKTQIHMLRGLRARLAQLRNARSADRETLESERNRTIRQFVDSKNQMKLQHAERWRSAMTDWDTLLDKQFAEAERDTLHSSNQQRLKSKKLKSEFIENKAKDKSEYENQSAELRRKRDEASLNLKAARDSIKAKLDRERVAVDQQMQDCREWVGMRTGDTALQGLSSNNTLATEDKLRSISDLQSVAGRIEEIKKSLSASIARMESHPVCRISRANWFLSFSAILGAITAAIAWYFGSVPLIVGVVGVISAILFMAIIQYATAPLVARTIRRMLPPIVDQENLVSSVLDQGQRIADFSCQQEISRLDKQYSASQQILEEAHREKRMSLLKEFDASKTNLTLACSERRNAISASRRERHSTINLDRKPKIELLEEKHAEEERRWDQSYTDGLAVLELDFHRSQERTVRRWLEGCKSSANLMLRVRNRAMKDFPDWNSDNFTSGAWPRLPYSLTWRIGDIEPIAKFQQEVKTLALPEESPQQLWSVFYDVVSHGAFTLETDPECKETAANIVRNTLLRAVTSVPAGNLNITIIDPEGLGKQFSWLMALADVDPSLVNHRVWTQPLHIGEQLANTARHVEDVIQQSLRNKHPNVLEYNRNAGPMKIPCRIIVWSNFPFGLDDN